MKIINSFKYAFNGILTSLKEEQNFRIHIYFTVVVLLFSIVLQLSSLEWILIILSISLVLFAELINTSIEATLDVITKEKHPRIKTAKDIAAAAVLTTALSSSIIGLIIFIPKIIELFK